MYHFNKKLYPKLQIHQLMYRNYTHAVQKWQHYLLGSQFIIETDQKSLKELTNQVVQTPDQHCYLTKLLGCDYIISYKPDKTNKVADALS